MKDIKIGVEVKCTLPDGTGFINLSHTHAIVNPEERRYGELIWNLRLAMQDVDRMVQAYLREKQNVDEHTKL